MILRDWFRLSRLLPGFGLLIALLSWSTGSSLIVGSIILKAGYDDQTVSDTQRDV